MRRCVYCAEVVEIKAEDELADGLGTEFEHVGVDVPRLVALVQLVKDFERVLDRLLHCRCVMPDRLGSKGWREELVDDAPLLGVGIAEEDAGLLVLDWVQRVVFIDDLGEELALCKHDAGEGGVVGVVDGSAHGARLEHRAVHVKQALVVA
jgi:hypothetical protein